MSRRVPELRGAVSVRVTVTSESWQDPARMLREVLRQVPAAQGQPTGTLVVVPDQGADEPRRSGWMRLVSRPKPRIPAWARCTALLAGGYVRIGSGCDASGTEWVWGYAP